MRTTTFPNTAVARRPTSQPEGQLSAALTKTIPFDYVFEFKLSGKAANNVQDVVKLQDVVEISMQGVFVATSMGYSFVLDERKTPLGFSPVIDSVTTPQSPVGIPVLAIGHGGSEAILVAGMPNAEMTLLKLTDTVSDRLVLQVGGGGIGFRPADQPLRSGETDLIGIGQDGTVLVRFGGFAPTNSEFRVLDRRNSFLGQAVGLSSILIGPDLLTKRLPAAGDDSVQIYGISGTQAKVFLLEGNTGERKQIDIPLGAPGFTLQSNNNWGTPIGTAQVKLIVSGVTRRLAPGDLLLVQSLIAGVPQTVFTIPNPRLSSIPLRAIATGLAGTNFGSTSGFRLSQRAASVFAADPPLSQISPDILSKAFEPACGAEGVSFLYSIDVVSTGRELQNKPIHNIAGLGIANGDRPFRPFARPIAFEPRSVVRIQIEERSTLPGTLYIVLQGYKTLGTGRRPD